MPRRVADNRPQQKSSESPGQTPLSLLKILFSPPHRIPQIFCFQPVTPGRAAVLIQSRSANSENRRCPHGASLSYRLSKTFSAVV
ncbi:hypothetical protein RRG08_045414 [Elysia crispata]|uniref:Uncharacterized protein n=1 Tax=Elysia crispata TaxID=231223 RepID=A0AAE0XMF2_9GAST|nr:hypothetical protein RRG08_045414 [Elysia crispata]